ncbi:beta-galactosidase GanA [Microbacterium amylolyticum]|uniref:Beta-galactosidase GanA n=1 Tax=Microbacterium amylolyticum TaxID=936337 RepID=A0ABS4ZIW9_9MICO|nr:beta-galactosidase GanA [Microbacterium amylolyticum]
MSPTPHVPGTFSALSADIGIGVGGDYNPEQWPRETWREDVDLMREAGVNLVTVGVFSWAMIEPEPGRREFAWLDEVLELLHDGGIAVDLATTTASPPPWLGVRYPETLPVDREGVRLVPGSRNQFSPSSRVYREHALSITRDLATRYAHHPAVRMGHIGNEYGQIDYGDEAAREFRTWLREKYGTIAALNDAWGTAFWSQRYADFGEILPPRRMPYLVNPTQSLDFRRFSSDQMLVCYLEQRDAIQRAGAERFHSAMLPHAGADSDVFRGVVRQGHDLRALREVVGTPVATRAPTLLLCARRTVALSGHRPMERSSPRTAMRRPTIPCSR